MMSRDYIPAFLADAREYLQELGLAIVRIEAAPDDRETADQLFRIAHSLKGMSATMGCEQIAALTHAMEDVLELLRQRSDGLPREVVDVLSACLDALEAAVEGIAAEGEERLDATVLVARLRTLARERTPEQELAAAGGAALPDLTAALPEGHRIAHVAAELADDATMAGVRAYMLLDALRAHGELLGSVPAVDHAERFDGHRVEAWIATADETAAVEATAVTVGDFARVVVREVETQPAPADPVAAPAVSARRAGGTVRVDAERLDELLHLMGELVIHRTAVESLVRDVADPALSAAVQRLTRSSHALQATVTRVRMVPVESVFLRFPRVVRDVATRLGKQVELRLVGQDTELDRTVVDALGDPLVHLVRNALDHGLESPAERTAAGKPPTGTLEISARHAGGHVIVSVRDDGRGIDVAAVAQRAQDAGLLDPREAAELDVARAAELLFAPGFTTAPATTDLSGRGVGMDAVRTSVRALGGEVTLRSEPGEGMVAQVRLPLTLASVRALLVTAGGLPFAIPLDRVQRTLRLADHAVDSVGGRPVLALADETLPLFDAGAVLGAAKHDLACPFAVVVRGAERHVALAVSELVGQRELVTRRLPAVVSERAAAAGGAVLADGSIALVVDCDALAAREPLVPALA
jgi:two-component system chemotaxis sensor kinase CheA